MDALTKGSARQYMGTIALADSHVIFTLVAIIEMTVVGYVFSKHLNLFVGTRVNLKNSLKRLKAI
jgi:hypothetical protein